MYNEMELIKKEVVMIYLRIVGWTEKPQRTPDQITGVLAEIQTRCY
jgi:hypothetical protein